MVIFLNYVLSFAPSHKQGAKEENNFICLYLPLTIHSAKQVPDGVRVPDEAP